MKCPKCNHLNTKVLDSRLTEAGQSIRRRRECEKCRQRFTTFERRDLAKFVVIKKDDTRQAYNREKLLHGIWTACTKLPITQDQINKMVEALEEEWNKKEEVKSAQLGEDVLDALRQINQVAYIRFASVYREFSDTESFSEELQTLSSRRKKKAS